jgi:hypothetical protein
MVVEVITVIVIYVLLALALGVLLRFKDRGAAGSSETGDVTDD